MKHLLFLVLLLPFSISAYADADADADTFIVLENRTEHVAKVAAPGGKPTRVQPGESDKRMMLEVSTSHGIDAKAWWVHNPRQLCVIFVRYEGRLVIAGDEELRCLGK
jgi:hypothetical protein